MKKITNLVIVALLIFLAAIVATLVASCLEEPIIESYGSSSINYCQFEDAYLIEVNGELLQITEISKGEYRTLHDGMLVFYLQVFGDDEIYFSSEPFVPEDWAKEIAYKNLHSKFYAALSITILLLVMIIRIIVDSKSETKKLKS